MNDEVLLKDVQPERNRGGKWVPFGSERYLVPPLSLLAVQQLADDVESLSTMTNRPTPEQMGVVIGIVHAAMKRNYPSMTPDDLGEMIDLGNWQEVMAAVLMISGYDKKGDRPSGETVAPTGATSTSA
jgi:hypothetical protein